MCKQRALWRMAALGAVLATVAAGAFGQGGKSFRGGGGGGNSGGFSRGGGNSGSFSRGGGNFGNSNMKQFNQGSQSMQRSSSNDHFQGGSSHSFDSSRINSRMLQQGSGKSFQGGGSNNGKSSHSFQGSESFRNRVGSQFQGGSKGGGQGSGHREGGSNLGKAPIPGLSGRAGQFRDQFSGKGSKSDGNSGNSLKDLGRGGKLDSILKGSGGEVTGNRGDSGSGGKGRGRGESTLGNHLNDLLGGNSGGDHGKGGNRGSSNSGLGNLLERSLGGREFHDNPGSFQQRLKSGQFEGLTRGNLTNRVNWSDQLRLAGQGDVARRLNLTANLVSGGGWDGRHHGQVVANYRDRCHNFSYCGPTWYPRHCWYPTWSPWVNWCWNYSCDPLWDPRPWHCRPVVYQPCVRWVYYDCPVWESLPVVACGTWVDVVTTPAPAVDLRLLAVRFVDPGHPEQNQGPLYRVWLQNASSQAVSQPFNVTLLAGNSETLEEGLPQAGVEVTGMAPEAVQVVDVRLPVEVNAMGRDEAGEPAPFVVLHVLLDSNRSVEEVSESNNGAAVHRGEIFPVDPAVFKTDAEGDVNDGAVLKLAGEGLGPEPGQVIVHLVSLEQAAGDKIEVQAEVQGWCDRGIEFKLPPLPLAMVTEAELIVVRGDGATANPLPVKIQPIQASLPSSAPQVAVR